jgi:hypothetical protein
MRPSRLLRVWRVCLGVVGGLAVGAATASAADALRLVRLSPPSGDILGTWGESDWHTQAGAYIEAEFEYHMDSVPLAAVNWWPRGLHSMYSYGWRTFGPGSGRFTVRFTRNCIGETKPTAPIISDELTYDMAEQIATGSSRVLASGAQPASWRFICPDRRLPDLAVQMAAPTVIAPGEPLPADVAVIVRNRGGSTAPGTIDVTDPANGYMVDLVLSTDEIVPEGAAVVSTTFREDALILGGRVSRTHDLAAGALSAYPLAGMFIPADTPPGLYFLCARVDPWGRVRESNERNNVACAPVQVGSLDPVWIDFERVHEPGAVPGADATNLYARLGVTFPSHPRIIDGVPISSGFQSLMQGDDGPRPPRTCGALEIALHPSLHARRVQFEARNLGFIGIPVRVATTARDADGAIVARDVRVNESRLGALRPFELIRLRIEPPARDIRTVTLEYNTCPPNVVIDNLSVNLRPRP